MSVERGDLHFVCGLIIYAHTPLDIPTGGHPHEHGKYDALDGVKGTEFRGVLNMPRGK